MPSIKAQAKKLRVRAGVDIGGRRIPPGKCEAKKLPDGRVLVSRAGEPAEITTRTGWTAARVARVLAAIETTHERGEDAIERLGLRARMGGAA